MVTKDKGYDGVADLERIELWYVQGVTGEYFTTKLAAEVRATTAFPLEGSQRRYARVFSRHFYKEV